MFLHCANCLSSYFYCKTFLAMYIIKTKFHNKIENEFLTDSLMLYIKIEIIKKFNIHI
jgi:hypothetical protein